MDPVLKWAGGKRWHVPMVRPLWRGERVVELFAGGAAVSLALEPAHALLNDANKQLMNFYRWLRAAKPYVLETRRHAATYYAYREWFNGCDDPDLSAQLFYYLNQHGFNGLYRVNARGEFNVPVRPVHRAAGGLRPIEVECPVPDDRFARVAARWELWDVDFSEVVLEPHDFVYADPPYDEGFTGYRAGGFSWDEQERLGLLLAGHPGTVVITNRATDRILELYRRLGFTCTLIDSKQAMHRSRGRNDVVLEVMATNRTIDPHVMMNYPSNASETT